MYRIRALALIFLIAYFHDAAASLPVYIDEFTLGHLPSTLRLSRGNVIPGSVRITVNGELLTDESYAVDRKSGTIKFFAPSEIPSEIAVTYSCLWFDVPEYFAKRKLGAGSLEEPPAPIRPGTAALQPGRGRSESRLRVFGTKSLGVSAGTGTDMDLKQTLNISIDGYLTKGLRVSGVISDQSRPELSGISTSIGEVDKISLQLTSQMFTAAVGDIDFNRKIGQDGEIRKSLKGGTTSVNSGVISSSATIGGIKSKHGRIVVTGRDGVAGPYNLAPSGPQTVASIIPGTERVWLDGRELRRGADADYQIDYLLGDMTFPPTISITSQSRIEADFEYLDENYRQDFLAGSIGFGDSASHLRGAVELFRQKDSYGDPSRFALAESDLAILASAGDSSDLALRSGVTEVDSGAGNYARDIVEADTVYRYAGEGEGSFRVSFSAVGQGNGDYSYVGGGVYEFAGRNKGAYQPIVLIPLPEKSDAASLSAHIAFDRFGLSTFATVTNRDRNTASSRDDDNNVGSDFSGMVSALPLRSADSASYWAIEMRADRRESAFHLPGKTHSPEWARFWGLRSDSVYSLAENARIEQRLRIGDRAHASVDYGGYRDRNFSDANRYSIELGIRPLSRVSLEAARNDRVSDDKISSRGARLFENRLAVSSDVTPVRIGLAWNNEFDNRVIDSVSSGRRFGRYSFTGGVWGLNSQLVYDDHELLEEGWRREYDSRQSEIRYNGSGWLSDSRFGLSVIHRRVHREIPDTIKETQLAIATDYRAGNSSSVFELSLNYRVNREGAPKTTESFIRVGKGEGDYRFENSVYVADALGEYIRVDETLRSVETGVLVARLFNLQTRLANWKKCPQSMPFLKRLTFETYIKSSEQGGANERFSAGWMAPFAGLFENTRYSLDRSIRQTVRAALDGGSSLFLSADEQRSEHPTQPSNLYDYTFELVGRGDFRLSRLVQLTLEQRFRRIDQDSRSFGNAAFTEYHSKPSVKYTPMTQLEFVLKPSYLIDRGRDGELNVTMAEAAAEINLRLAGSGRLSVRGAFQSVVSSNNRIALPYQFALGRRIGENSQWGATIDFRISETLSAGLTYDGERIPGMDVRHLATATARARF